MDGQTLILVAAIVAAMVQLVKYKFQLSGVLALIVAITASVAGAYAGASPDEVLSLSFLLEILKTVFVAGGIFGVSKTVAGK